MSIKQVNVEIWRKYNTILRSLLRSHIWLIWRIIIDINIIRLLLMKTYCNFQIFKYQKRKPDFNHKPVLIFRSNQRPIKLKIRHNRKMMMKLTKRQLKAQMSQNRMQSKRSKLTMKLVFQRPNQAMKVVIRLPPTKIKTNILRVKIFQNSHLSKYPENKKKTATAQVPKSH